MAETRGTRSDNYPDDPWFRVEVTDREGQVVAIEPEMLAGRDIGEAEWRAIRRAIDHLAGFLGRDDGAESDTDALASRLIDAWVADKGRKIPWAKAVQIIAIVTKQSNAERDRLLRMGDEDGSCEMCGRRDPEEKPLG